MDKPQVTHWEDCWKDPKHHDCAVEKILSLQDRGKGLEEQAQHLRGDVLMFSEQLKACIDELKKIQDFIERTDEMKLRPEELISNATISFFGKFTKTMRDIEKCLRIMNDCHDFGDAVYDVKEREMEGWGGPKVTAYANSLRELKELVNL